MQVFTQALKALKEYEDLERNLAMGPGIRQVTGCIDAGKPHLIYGLKHNQSGRIVVTFSEQKAKEL